MEIKFETLLIGAEGEDIWLCDLKHSNIKIERNLYFESELKEKYYYLKLDSRWPFWFDTEDNKYICYELVYIEKTNLLTEKELEMKEESIFAECENIICLINCYLGTIIGMNFGNFYVDNKSTIPFSNTVLLPYNPSVLEDYSKIEIISKDLKYFMENIEIILEKGNEIDTIIETYNINLSIPNMKIAFLNLVTCLESLLVNNNLELTYQISRGVAVLLSKSKEEGSILFSKMKKLYELRSILVHNGIWNPEKYYKLYNNEPFEDLKEIFILSFRKFIELNLNKAEFIKKINENGYGDLNK